MAEDVEMESPRSQPEELLTQQEPGITDFPLQVHCMLTMFTWVLYLSNLSVAVKTADSII